MLLCDLEIVLLVLMRLRTSEVRELQAMMSHQGLSGVATEYAF